MEHGEAVKRTKRKWWVYLAAIAIALWLAFALWVYLQPKYDYEPTGDELFDRLAMLVLAQTRDYPKAQGWVYSKFPSIKPEYNFDFSQINEWEDEYGDDPRYWQLRWYFAEKSNPLTSQIPTVSQPTLDVISKMDEGIYNGGSFYAIEYYALLSVDPQKALELASLAIESEPDNAHFHYLLASLLNKDGQTEAAFAKLKDGNRASRYSSAGVYPLNVVVGHPELFNKDSNRVVGCDVYLYSGYITLTYLYVKLLVWDILQQKERTVSPEDLDELMEYSRRFQKQEFRSILNGLVSTIMVVEVLDHFKGLGSVLNADQQAELDQIEIAKKTLVSEFKNFNQQTGTSMQSTGQFESPYKSSIGMYEGYSSEKEFLEQNQLLFDLVTPPLFSIWARGETVGILDKVRAGAPPSP